jgi:nucleoside-diphosphate-sugar epimerase
VGEEKLVSALMDPLHFWLIGGIIAVLYLLKSIDAIRNQLFSDKYRWLVTPLNMVLSFVGVFILKMTGANVPVIHQQLPENDPKTRQPDISLAQKLLGWEPKIPLEEGLVKTIPYFRKMLEKQ